MLPCGSPGRLIMSFSMLTIKTRIHHQYLLYGRGTAGTAFSSKDTRFVFANPVSCFRAGDNLSPSPITIDLVQKHSETALDAPKKRGYREQFSYKSARDTRQDSCNLRISRGANVVQKPKEKSQILENQRLAI